MSLSRSLLAVPGLGALAIAGACTINTGSGESSPQSPAGTTPLAATQSDALVTGTVDPSLSGSVQVSVNATTQSVVVAPDNSFVVRDVPTGDVKLGCQAGGITGTLTISGVQPGEIIEVTIKREGDALVIGLVQRTPSSQPPAEVTRTDGDALVIHDSHVCYWLKPGHYKRDIVVQGDDVHLFGAAHQSCVVDDFSILDGKLELDGSGDRVLDVELGGSLVINGTHCGVQDTCTRCFDDGCQHACDDTASGTTCGPSERQDAGATEDAPATVPVTPPDSGAFSDGGVSLDASAGEDASSSSPDTGLATDAARVPNDAAPVEATIIEAGPVEAAMIRR